jgi:hypothetical protein
MKKATLFILTSLLAWGSLTAQSIVVNTDSLPLPLFQARANYPCNHNLCNECNSFNKSSSLSGKEKMKAEAVQLHQHSIRLTNNRQGSPVHIYLSKSVNRSTKEQMKAEVMKLHTCSIHPLTALDKKDICPKCSRIRAVEDLEKRLNIKG